MKNKTINYELGVRVTISCKMMFDDYPLDAHKCQFQVGSCKCWEILWISLTNSLNYLDYDTIETVICSSKFLYNQKRQRSLQHYIEIEPLPEKYKVVDLPSGTECPENSI